MTLRRPFSEILFNTPLAALAILALTHAGPDYAVFLLDQGSAHEPGK
ncbi:MAG: hypothetical protein ACYC35_04940 [Pirellulales bacterium]